jgi:ribose 5-phosphate isomerase B
MMRIAIGSDHAGYRLKGQLVDQLDRSGYDVIDLGAHDPKPTDYPDLAEAVGLALLEGRAKRGVVICGSGVGASVAANKLPGIRAGLCHDLYSAHQGVEHDDMNVLVLGARIIGPDTARGLVQAFLQASFSEEDRHVRRLRKIAALETRYGVGSSVWKSI